MRRTILVLTLMFVMVGCGDDGPSDAELAETRASEAAASASASASAEAEAKAEARAAAQRRRHQQCADSTADLSTALQEIDSRLSVGMNYDEYGDFVGDAQVAYDRLFDGPDLSRQCLLKVGIPLEGALNIYIDVYGIWGDCINDYGCDFSEGETNKKVQAKWAKATEVLGNSKRGLEGMKPA
jgi:hypothetical protein